MNVVSLFDGKSDGQFALKKAKVKVKKYYASEIDKHVIKVAQDNFPNTIQLGDVLNLNGKSLKSTDLLIGGSPCQGFSFAGKGLNFNDPRSKLFFEYVRIKNEINPKYFFYENVHMKKVWQDIISDFLGVEPIKVNSNIFSPQNRLRYYWTNIPIEKFPEDKGLVLKDIIEKNVNDYLDITRLSSIKDFEDICRRNEYNKESMFFVPVDSHSSKNGLICIGGLLKKSNKLWLNDGKVLQRNFSQGNRVYSEFGKSATLSANSGGIGGKTGLYEIDGRIRRLTVTECERLQGVPDGSTFCIAPSQAIKALGNGWNVDTVAHFFKNLA